jgi:hypothetical protein
MPIEERRIRWMQSGGMSTVGFMGGRDLIHVPQARGLPQRLRFLWTKNALLSTRRKPKREQPTRNSNVKSETRGLLENEKMKEWYVDYVCPSAFFAMVR